TRRAAGVDRGRSDAVQLIRRTRPAGRTVPDYRADPGRRSGRPHRHRPGAGADRDAARPRPHRRRWLPVHALCARRLIDPPMATVVGIGRRAAFTTSLIVVTALLAGCAPGLAANPRFATNAGARP